jgi:multidrug efflux pump subunit AcrA (membrane-fusion protein)
MPKTRASRLVGLLLAPTLEQPRPKSAAEANERAAEARKKAVEAEAHLADARARAAEAERHAAEARASAAQAEGRAAQANERAAALEKDAATARLEQEKLKATLAWRIVPLSEAVALQHALAGHPGTVNLWYTAGDPESLYLALQIGQILEKAGWKVNAGAVTLAGIVFGISTPPGTKNGIEIASPSTASTDLVALRGALRAAGIDFSEEPLPPIGSIMGSPEGTGSPILMIGSRRPAVFP